MPAIQVDRLKAQIQSILEPKFPPPVFRDSLRSLMEAHANLAFRPGYEVLRRELMDSYHLAPVIHNQLRLSLTRFSKSEPDLALSYADILWEESYLEMKQMTGIILGALPNDRVADILKRVVEWSNHTKERALRTIIFEESTRTIRENGLNQWLEVIKKWTESGNPAQIVTALQAMMILVQDARFENIPFVFSTLGSINLLRNERIMNAISELIQHLLERSTVETTAFVKSMILSRPSADLFRIIRRNLDLFPKEQQVKMRELMKDGMKGL